MTTSDQQAPVNNQEEAALQLILAAGDSRDAAFRALKMAREGDFEAAERHLEAAHQALKTGHELQTALLQREAGGVSLVPTLLLVHAHAHLMNAQTQLETTQELVEVYRRLPPPAPAL